MRFDLVDRVIEQAADRIVTLKNVTAAEEYLQDHFPTFPVLPGVLMLECMVQAGRRLVGPDMPLVLGRVRALKYGRFVRPGDSLVSLVTLIKTEPDGGFDLKGEARVGSPDGPVACSGRFTLRLFRPPAL